MPRRSAILAIALVAAPHAFAQGNLKALEGSEFCKRYGCPAPKTWPLTNGAVNHSYQPNVRPAVSLEALTLGDAISSYGLSFYERKALTPKDLDMIWSLVASVHPGGNTPALRQFVQSHIEIPVPQILKAKTTVVGPYRLWAGKVGDQQIVQIRLDMPAVAKPAFAQVGHQGMTYLVVVSAKDASGDGQLLAIARYLSNEEKRVGGRGEVHVWAWTDKSKAASRIPMTDAQAEALVAQVHVNPSKGVERVERPNR